MKDTLLNLLRKSRYCVVELCVTLPIILILHVSFAQEFLWLVWLWPVSFAVLDVVSLSIPGKRRLLYGFCEVLSQFAIGGLFLWLSGGVFWLLIVPLIQTVLLLWGLTLDADGRKTNFWGTAGIVVHIGVQIYRHTRVVAQDPMIDSLSPWFLILFFLLAGLSVLNMNQNGLRKASSGRQGVSHGMQRKNILLTLAFFGIALLLACTPIVVKGALWLFTQLSVLLSGLMSGGLTSSSPIPGQNNSSGIEKPNIPIEETPMAPWLNFLLTVVAIVVVVVILALAVFLFSKKISQIFRYLGKLLSRKVSNYVHAVSEDYEDEVTDLREDENDRAELARKKQKLSSIDERRLSPERRIRYRYLRLMHKHPEWSRSSTARDNIPLSAASLYERVRYSPHSVSEEHAQQFLNQTKKI